MELVTVSGTEHEVHLSNMSYLHESLIYEYGIHGAAALILDEIMESARAIGYKKAMDALYYLRDECDCFPIEIHRLVQCVQFDLASALYYAKRTKPGVKESDMQKHFFDNLSVYLPNGKKAKVKQIQGSTPDGFVSINGVIAPVEVKLDCFNNRALSQLLGYMRVYGADFGIAVASKCIADLPDNVTFVCIDHESILNVVMTDSGDAYVH